MSIHLDVLRQVDLFTGLEKDDLAHIAAVARDRHFERGEIILLEGELGGALYVVYSGLVKVFKTSPEGKEQVLRLIAPIHTFNDVPALDGGPNPASAAALEPTAVYALGHGDLQTLIAQYPGVASGAVRMLANALRHLVGLVETLSFRHVTARVAKILLDQEQLAHSGGTTHRLTQQEIAAMAGTAREMVGRALKELETAGAIELKQGRPIVLQPERLHLLAHDG
ncbi:MAG TPA: Crp/Fnr family transcriptional regulator [Ktedonobacterales bacterium]|jgi:CRP/FNR family transcriptional regulator|nr:Crp/Fnr family transcriptional regulator [Ktedonobacterales bacterium]